MVDTNDQWIQERTGIRERHIVEPGVATSDLATAAAIDCLARRGVDASELDAIIVATVTPDMFFPATACIVLPTPGASISPPPAPASSTPSRSAPSSSSPAPTPRSSSSAPTS
jgi:3-oxoacyl-[acyl-carrier-protein] synthase III